MPDSLLLRSNPCNTLKGIEMKALKYGSFAIILTLAGAVHAQAILVTVPDVPVPVSTLTRAEVLADLQIWRLSGLAELNRGERVPNTQSDEYRQAQARYEALRESSEFTALVAELARRPYAMVVAR